MTALPCYMRDKPVVVLITGIKILSPTITKALLMAHERLMVMYDIPTGSALLLKNSDIIAK